MARSHRPNMLCLEMLQKYSTRGWVYRQEEGWIFAELSPDELGEFKSYEPKITLPRMRVRLPYSQAIWFRRLPDNLANWFAYCTMLQAPPLVQIGFQIHQITDKPKGYPRYPVEPGSYEGWLWADEITMCRGLGCEITVHHGWGWCEWGVPVEWRPPYTKPPRLRCKEHTSIYALVDEIIQEVGYIGQSENPKQRYVEHLRDTHNLAKAAWIQRLRAEGRKPGIIILEEKVAVEVADKQERYWIAYYWNQGHNLTNEVCRNWPKPDVLCHVSLPLD